MKRTGERMIDVDMNKLMLAVYKRNSNLYRMSLAIGYHKNYLINSAKRGVISKQAAYAMEHMFGIEQSEYEADKVEEHENCAECEDKETVLSDCDFNILHSCIYDAVYHAMVEALGGAKK